MTMTDDMYIRTQFQYHLGPAVGMVVWFDVDAEVWHVSWNGRAFTMQVTSDDTSYLFTCKTESGTVTVQFPFQSE